MENEGSINIYRYISIVVKYRWLVLIMFLLLIISGMFVVAKQKDMYAAHSKILVNYQMGGVSSDISRFFMKGTIAYLVKTYSLTIVSNRVIKKTKEDLNLPYSIGYLRSHVFVTAEEGTNLINISATLDDKVMVAKFLNTLIKNYVIMQKNFLTEDSDRARTYINEQLGIIEKDMNNLQTQIKDFKEKNGVVDVAAETQKLVETFSQLRYEKLAAINEKKSVLTSLNTINKTIDKLKIGDKKNLISSIENSPEYNSYITLQEEYEKASLYYEPSSNYMKLLDEKLKDLKKKIYSSAAKIGAEGYSIATLFSQKSDLEKRLIALNLEINKTDNMLSSLDNEFKGIPEQERDYSDLMRKLGVNEKLYSMLLEQEKELALQQVSTGSTIRVVDEAVPASRPVTTSKVSYALFVFIFSLVVAVGFAFLIEYMDTTVKPSDNIEKLFKIDVLGKIPEISQSEKKLTRWQIIFGKRDSKGIRSFKDNLLTSIDERSTIHESYKELRTLLNYSKYLKGKELGKSIMITSSETKEGKSITAANLSIVLAKNNKKVVLIDADMRKPAVHRIFSLENSTGLTNYFDGTIKLDKIEDIIQPGINSYHSIITCGPHSHHSSEYLDSENVKKLIDKLSQKGYEYIIFDTPPVNALTDAVVLSNKVDGVIFVIRANQISRHRVQLALEGLRKNENTNIIGAVLNGISLRGGYGYYYYYYGQTYYYSYYSEDKDKAKDK